MGSAVEVVRRFGGRADRAGLLRHVSAHEIAVAVGAQDLVRVARGLYVLPELPDELTMAAVCRGVVSHDSAARVHGLELVFPPTTVHVTAARGARPEVPKQVTLHRRRLESADVLQHVTSIERTVADCCTLLPFREALAVADSAARMVDLELLHRVADRPGPGRARRRRVLAAADPRAANAFESALRGSLVQAGLHLVPQLTIRTAGGSYRVDLADPRTRTVVEADSHAWHGSRAALSRDCRRYNELVRAGWRVLRFSWEQVMFEPEWVVAVVADVMGRRAG